MKFNEAMILLKQGKKVTRHDEKDKSYFIIENGVLKYRISTLKPYCYDQEIMISEGWFLSNDENKEYTFSEIIPFLLHGNKAKLKGWDDAYIYYDASSKIILIRSMIETHCNLDMTDFIAQDWIEII